MYEAADVAAMGLDADGLILVALLAGSDYSVCSPPWCAVVVGN